MHTLISRLQNGGHYHDIKIANRSFENVEKLRYFGKTLIDQHLIHEDI
jgi:hypothetical protein